MKIYVEKSLEDFEFWSGAQELKEKLDEIRFENPDIWDRLEAALEMEYPDGIDETTLNDLFWFEPEYICELIGIDYDDDEEEDDEDDE